MGKLTYEKRETKAMGIPGKKVGWNTEPRWWTEIEKRKAKDRETREASGKPAAMSFEELVNLSAPRTPEEKEAWNKVCDGIACSLHLYFSNLMMVTQRAAYPYNLRGSHKRLVPKRTSLPRLPPELPVPGLTSRSKPLRLSRAFRQRLGEPLYWRQLECCLGGAS